MLNMNYYQRYKQILQNQNGDKKLLLHSCCAPCSSTCLERVTNYFLTDVYFYNPNITCVNEFDKRLSEQIKFVREVYGNKIKVIETPYQTEQFYSAINGMESLPEKSARCYICYQLRLEETAKYAKDNGYDYFTTTLSLSPHKNAEWINKIGEELEAKYGVKFLYSDFKKEGGYLRSIELSKKYDLYRQDYCGCVFSRKA